MAAVLKTAEAKASVGSNPTPLRQLDLGAIFEKFRQIGQETNQAPSTKRCITLSSSREMPARSGEIEKSENDGRKETLGGHA